MQSPYLQIANKSMAEMRKWLTEFGMTPSSRAGMKVENPKPKSKAELFRDRKRGAKT
jgi:phage terminase small subunit